MTRGYRKEADALDEEILQCIARNNVPDFNDLALRLFAHQMQWNEPYARYCAELGVTPGRLPATWEAIPPMPSGAFKEAAICTFDPDDAELTFETSGTTRGTGGMHYMEHAVLYDAALLAGFREAMLEADTPALRYLLLVPNPLERPRSSLGYMMDLIARRLGDGDHAWLLGERGVDVDGCVEAARRAERDGVPVCLAGTAFAFVQLLDGLRERRIEALALSAGSRIMETGGFKGRTRVVQRSELYTELAQRFAVPASSIVAEYGMTELTSQYYDAVRDREVRVKAAPPWLRARVVGANGETLPQGTVGALAHVDLANRSSCVAVQTEDLGIATEDGGIILIGREHGAELRGCSLDAEALAAAAP